MSCDEFRDRIAAAAGASATLDDETTRHLEGCARCRAEADDLRRAATVLRAAHVLESTRSRRASLFADPARSEQRFSRAAIGVAIAAAIVVAIVLALRSKGAAPLTWSGEGKAVALAPGRARLESGSVRFEATAAFEVETRVARLAGDRATFVATLAEEGGSMKPSVNKAIVCGAGVAAAIALIVFVESGSVEVRRDATEPTQHITAGERRVIALPKAPPTATREKPDPVAASLAPVSNEATPTRDSPAPLAASDSPADDTKRGSVHGVLLFDDGAPVANEIVWLWGDPHVVSKTDANGFFRIDRDWLSNSPRNLMVGPEGTAIDVGEVVLVVDEDREVRFTIPRGIELDVLVTDEAGVRPLAGIWIAFRRQDEPVAQAHEGSAYGTTGEDGRVQFRHLHRSQYLVEVHEKGWRHHREMLDLSNAASGGSHVVRLRVADVLTVHVDGWTLGESTAASLQLMPTASGSFEHGWGKVDANGNFVTDAPPAGQYVATLSCDGWSADSSVFTVPERGSVDVRVQKPSGEVVDGVVVTSPPETLLRCRIQTWPIEGFERREGSVDDAGNFRIEHVARGRNRVRLELEDQGVAGIPDDVDVPAGGVAGMVIRLSGGTLTGRVIGAPESGLVQTSHREGELWVDKGYLRPDVDGSFRGRWLAPGRWRLSTTRSRGGYARPVEVDVEMDKTTSGVVLEWRSCPTVQLVLRHRDGTALVGKQGALLMPTTSAGWATSLILDLDDRGRVTLHDIPPGTWKLRVNGLGEQLIDVVDGENPPIDVMVP